MTGYHGLLRATTGYYGLQLATTGYYGLQLATLAITGYHRLLDINLMVMDQSQ